jgi:hypothetical protein
MKKQVLRIVVFAMAISAASALMAQGPPIKVAVNVPFEFVVGSQHMPPGRYMVASAANGVLRIYDREVADNQMFLPVNSIESNSPKDAKLVFHRYGDTYFLAEVWNGNSAIGRQVLKSKAEKEIIAGRLNAPRPKAEVAVVRPEQ